MAILAFCIAIICLSSVSAVDNSQFNSTFETVNDISQDENIVIDEISDTDDAKVESGNVSVTDEKQSKNLLKASNEDVLGADVTGYIQIRETNSETDGSFEGVVGEQIGIDVYWQSISGMQFKLLVNNNEDQSFYPSGWGYEWSDTIYYTPQSEGTYNFQVISQGSENRYVSNVLTWTISGGSSTSKETEVTITVPSTGTTGTSFSIPYSVYEKGSTTGVNGGTLTFFDQNGQIGSPITLTGSSGSFSHTYSTANTYNIYATYTAASGYEDSTSSQGTITISDGGDAPSGSEDITLSFEQGSASEGNGNLYPFTDTQAWVSVISGAYQSPTYVNFAVDFGRNSQSNSVIQYKKSTASTWSEFSFTGTAPTLKFHNHNNDADVITWAGGNTYDVRVSNGQKTSNTLTVTCIGGDSDLYDFEYNPESGDEETAIEFNFKPMLSPYTSSTLNSGYMSFFSSESRNAASKLGTISASSASEFKNGFITGEITLPSVDATGETTIYYVFVGTSTSGSGYNDLDSFTMTVNNVEHIVVVTPEIAIDVNESIITKGDKIKVNVTVSSEGTAIDEGHVAFYYENDETPIDTIDLANRDYIEIDSSELIKGTSYTVLAKYLGVENKYEAITSGTKQFKIKSALPISITVNDEDDELNVTTSYSTSVTVAADTGDVNPELIVLFDGSETSSKIYSGRTQTSYYLNANNPGPHTISVKFSGNDDYEESVSNEVTVNVYQQQSVSPVITFNVTNYAIEGEKVLITVSTGDAPLNVTLYSDSSATDEIVHLEGETNSYEFVLPITEGTDSSYSKTIYGTYDGATVGYVKYQTSSYYSYDFYKSLTVARQNEMTISSNIVDGKINLGDTLTLTVSNIRYWYRLYENYEYVTGITVYMDNDDTALGVFPIEQIDYYNYGIDSFSIELDDASKYSGQHSVYAKYGGYYYDSYSALAYAPTTSNVIEFTVKEDKTALVEVIADKYPNEVTVKVTSDIAGTYAVDINSTQLTVTIPEGETIGETTYLFDAGSYYANITGVPESDLYNINTQNTTFSVEKGDVGELKIIVNQISAGNEVTGTVITSVPGTYSVKIADNDPFEVEIEGSSKEFTADALPVADGYVAVVSLSGNKNYNDIDNQTTFNVVANTVDFNVSSVKDEYTYGEEVILTYNLPDGADGEITFTYVLGATGEAGKLTVPVDTQLSLGTALDAKEYSIQAEYNGGSLYESSTKTINFKVSPKENKVTVDIENVVYGLPVVISLSNAVEGTYTVTVNGKQVSVNVDSTGAGSASESLDLAVGEGYVATLSFDNPNYDTSGSTTFDVTPATNNVTVDVENVVYGLPVVISLSNAVEGTYTVTVNGKQVSVNVDSTGAGSASESLDLAVGEGYVATLSFDNPNYDTSGSTTFDVTPATNKVTVEVENVELPNEAVIELTADVAGTYRVYLDDMEYVDVVVTESNVKASATKALKAGNYTTSVEFTNANYTNDIDNAEFSVTAADSEFKMELTKQDYTFGDEVILKITLPSDATGKVTVTYSNGTVACEKDILGNGLLGASYANVLKVSESQYELSLGVLPAGDYSVSAKYSGDDKYSEATDDVTFVVSEQNNPSSTHIKIRDADYPDNSTITIDGATGSVTVRIQYQFERIGGSFGDDYDVKFIVGESTNDAGKLQQAYGWTGAFQFNVDYSTSFTIKAIYTDYVFMQGDIEETSNILTYDITFEQTVEDSISVESKEVNYGTKANLKVTGTDGEYTLTVNGKTYDVTVDGGEATAVIDVLAGNKTYEVSIVSKTDASLTNTSTLKVNPISPDVTVNADNLEYTYGGLTTITVGKNATATGNVKVYDGETELTNLENIKFDAGTHTIKAKYVADGNFTDDEDEITIKVSKATNELTLTVTNETYPDNVTITLEATLPGEYIVMIGTTSVPITVGENGIGTVSVRLNPAEEYIATVNFNDNGNYDANSAEFKFHVDGNTIGLNVTPKEASIEIGESVDLTASTENAANAKVTYKSDDGWETTADVGEVVTYTPATSGTHKVEVTYDDGIYDPQTVTATITVNKKQNNIKVEVTGSTYPENVTVKVTADVEGDYIVDINGTPVTVTANGEGRSFKFDAGSYYANITYSSETYEGITTNATFNVAKGTNNILIEAGDVTLPVEVTINVTADVAGDYVVKFDDAHEVTVNVANDGATGSATILVPSNTYTLDIVNYNDKNYDANITKATVTVSPEPVETTIEIRDGNNPSQSSISGDLIYDFLFEYRLQRADIGFVSENVTIYCNDLVYYVIENPVFSGEFTNIGGNLRLTDIGEYEFKAVWEGQTDNAKYTKSSNTIKFNIQSNPSSILKIRDSTYTSNDTITVYGKDSASITFEYFFTRENTNPYWAEKTLTVYVNGESSGSTSTVAENQYAKITLDFASSCDVNVYVTFVGSEYYANSYDEVSNVLTYHIVLDEPQTKQDVTVEVASVKYPEKANVTVKSNVDDSFIVDINGTTVDIDVVNGIGWKLVDLTPNNYTAIATSKTNSSVTNSTKFTVFDEDEKNTVTLDVQGATYPNQATINVNATFDGTYSVDINGTEVNVDVVSGKGSSSVKLDAGSYVAKLEDNIVAFVVSKGQNNVKVSVDDVKLPAQVVVKVTADVDGTYAVDINGTAVNVIVSGGEGSSSVSLNEGQYSAKVSWSDKNYDVITTDDSFTVYAADSSSSLIIRDANLPNNAIITVKSDENVSIVLEYYVEKPQGDLLKDSLEILINGEHFITIDNPQDKTFANIGGAIIVNETNDLTFTAIYSAWVFMGSEYQATSNNITYHITIENKTETKQTVTVEVSSVKYPEKANVTVKSNVDDSFIVDINGTAIDIDVVDGIGWKLVNLTSGNYIAVATSKTNSSITNSTKFTVFGENAEISVILNVSGSTYPNEVSVDVASNTDGIYTVDINGTSVNVDVVSGKGSSSVKLDAGSYVAKLEDNIVAFVVSKGQNNVKVSVDDVKLPAQVVVKVTADVDGTYAVDINGTAVNVIVSGGEGSAPVSLDAGQYSAKVSWSDKNYDVITTDDSFTVYAADSSSSLIIRDANLPNNATITVKSDENVSIVLEYYVEKPQGDLLKDSLEILINGEHFTTIDNPQDKTFASIGEIIVNETKDITFTAIYSAWIFMGSIYEATSNSITYHIAIENNTELKQTVSVEIDDVVLPEKVKIIVKSNVDDGFTVDINGTIIDIDVVDGTGSALVDLPVGNYNATVISKTNALIKNQTSFKVLENIEQSGNIIIALDENNTNAAVNVDIPDATGNVSVIVDGDELIIELVDGKISLPITDIGSGNHTIVVIYLGDDTHPAMYNASSFNVAEKITPEPVKKPTNATIDIPDDVKEGEDVVVNVDIPDATGNVSVIVDGSEAIVPLDENGNAKYTIPKVGAGNHSVVVIYQGDETHSPVHTASCFNVDAQPVITPVSSKFKDLEIGDDLSISMVLEDETGKTIPNAPIAYAVNGVANTVTTDGNGKFVIKAENGAEITIRYAGNEKTAGTNTTLKLNNPVVPVVPVVVKVATHFNVTNNAITINGYAVDEKAGEKGMTYTTILLDENGKPMAKVPINFAVNNKIYKRTTYENGSFAPYHLDMIRAGRYTMAFHYAGDDNHTATFACVCVDLDKKPIKIKASAKTFNAKAKTKKYTVSLSTIVGSSLDGKVYLKEGLKVTLTIKDKTYTAKTNSKGQATFKITKLTKKGKYSAKIFYKGDITYKEATKTVKLTIK